MRAAYYEQVGSARDVLKLGELPTPVPMPGEVRVRVAWSGVNPSDVKSRAGTRSQQLPFPRIIPHSDGAGVIDSVGDDVSADRVGERVWIWNAAWGRAFGTAAEYVTLPSAQAVKLPADVDLADGASLGIPVLTAWYSVEAAGGVQGKSVLIAGGAGAVGHYAIQFARLNGARSILTTVSSPEKAQLAIAAGADVAIDYRGEDVVNRVRQLTSGHGVDRVIEVNFGVNVGLDHQILASEGDVIVYGSDAPEIAVPFVPMILKNLSVSFFIVYNLSAAARAKGLATITNLLAAGKLTHNIAARLPLADIAHAHELVEQGRVMGNVVLSVEE